MKELSPEDLINHGNFFQETLLTSSAFITFCKDRGIDISEERLEKLEKLGIFLPALRINYPEIRIKRKTIRVKGQDDKIEEFGILREGEKWNGELRKDYASFIPFDPEYVSSWIDEGLLIIPKKESFVPWSRFKDKEGWHKANTYYSIFQVYVLKSTIRRLTAHSYLEDLQNRTEKQALEIHRWRKKHFRDVLRAPENDRDRYWILCHFLSRRYLPDAKSDGVLITVPAKEFSGFDFFEYRRSWNANNFLTYVDSTPEEIKNAWEWFAHTIDSDNPLTHWDELVSLVKLEKRKQLKKDALYFETLKMMAKILNHFYEDLTGERLCLYYSSPQHVEVRRGKGITREDLLYKEFVANEFGVNPRPRLILMVEGEGEFSEIPKFVKWAFGKSLAMYGIQILNLHSVGEASPRKIARFVDHFHDLQTLVYFILDNEGNSTQMRDKLVRTPSRYIRGFTVTKKELFTIWDKNIEFDNFSDAEIAEAMTRVSENRYPFAEVEINGARTQFGVAGDRLSALYKAKLSYDLNKPKLLESLFGYFENSLDVVIDEVKKKRPVLDVIDNVRHLAIRNYQPSSLDAWMENQNSDWLRTKITS